VRIPMHRIIALFCGIVLLAGSVSVAGGSAGQDAAAKAADPWIARTTKVQFQPQRAADAPVQVDLPKKDWMVLPSAGSVVLTLASRKGDAVVFVERSTMRQALAAEDITDLFAQIETDAITERHPKAADFQSKVLDAGDRRLVAVQYARQGVLGAERVRQYSVPVGKQLYRVTCISSAAQFVLYDPVFSHIAASFTATE
jgi:hypothetical protein